MLRTTLLAATLLLTPVAALASGDHHGGGYVIDAEPSIAVSIGAVAGAIAWKMKSR